MCNMYIGICAYIEVEMSECQKCKKIVFNHGTYIIHVNSLQLRHIEGRGRKSFLFCWIKHNQHTYKILLECFRVGPDLFFFAGCRMFFIKYAGCRISGNCRMPDCRIFCRKKLKHLGGVPVLSYTWSWASCLHVL